MSLYKYDDMGYFLGEYPENTSGNVPLNFTLSPPNAYPSGFIPRFVDPLWVNVPSYVGIVYYRKEDGTSVTWDYFAEPSTEIYTNIAPPFTFSTWDGTQWIDDFETRHQYETDSLNVQLPDLRTVPYSLREEFTLALDYLSNNVNATVIIKEETYTRGDIEYALLFFHDETQIFYNN